MKIVKQLKPSIVRNNRVSAYVRCTICREVHSLRTRYTERRDVYSSILFAFFILMLPLRDAVPVRVRTAGLSRAAVRTHSAFLTMPSALWHTSQADAVDVVSENRTEFDYVSSKPSHRSAYQFIQSRANDTRVCNPYPRSHISQKSILSSSAGS